MLRDYDAHRPNEMFAEIGTDRLTMDDAYAVQAAIAELRKARGERCLGYKVGCLSPSIQQQLGLNQPVRGYLWQGECHRSGARIRASDFSNLAVEGEIAVRISSGIPGDAAHASLDDLCHYVKAWFPVIELHNYVFRAERPTREELVAGNAMHAGFVAPLSTTDFDSTQGDSFLAEKLLDAKIRVHIDQALVEESNVSSLPGGLLGSVRWLVSSLATCKESLKPGHIVLTGSPGHLVPVKPGNTVMVSCEGQSVELFVA